MIAGTQERPMSRLTALVEAAYAAGASDLHLEPGLPPAFRIDGKLRIQQGPVRASELKAMAREVAGTEGWTSFLRSRSLDLSRSLAGVRCRINVLQSRRGVGMAIRLLTAFAATVDSLNLHPCLKELAELKHGLVLVSGPTGSGKSSTIAALVQEINQRRPAHVLTLEAPVEHWLKPQRAFIRQREVGRDTPSFEQGLIDALREDPDVIVVGEMRRPETMRLTLDAAETGHLVFSTVHSSSVGEAIHRIGSAFPAEARSSVQAQLADALAAVVCQTLVLRDDLGIRVPECEILRANSAARASIRSGALHQLATVLETGAADGSWTLDRYRRWLAGRERFCVPSRRAPGESAEVEEPTADLPPLEPAAARGRAAPAVPVATTGEGPTSRDGVFVLDDASGDPASILSELLSGPGDG
jgi:twitching motility protein PilT